MGDAVPDAGATIQERKWATKQLEAIVKKEAFVNTLKANLENLTTDIKVGTRFISTRDYDGNLYECKQEAYVDYMSRQMLSKKFYDNNKIEVVEQAKRIDPHTIDILWAIEPGACWSLQGHYIPHTNERQRAIEEGDWVGKTITIPFRHAHGDTLMARMTLAKHLYHMRENQDDEYPDVREIDFTITDIEVHPFTRSWMVDGERRQEMCMRVRAVGFYPQIERMVSRIWVRKCNLVAQALGKNIDSSRKSINFTKENMNVRDMLQSEKYKLEKVRKIFNKNNPAKSRSACLKQLKEENERLEPTLKRLETLIDDLYKKDINVPAYYCEKYGYLIPLKGQIIVDLSGNTIEQEIEKKNVNLREVIEKQIALRTQMVSEVIPNALHPERVERHMEKYGLEGVFGDDKTVAVKWSDGKRTEGVVNHSVLG